MMPPSAPLIVFVTIFAADQAGGIQAFHLDLAAGTLAPAAFTADCPDGFFLRLAPDRRTIYSLTAKKFGAADTEEVVAWRIADRDGRLETLGRRPATDPVTCYVAGDPVAVRHEGTGPYSGRSEGPHPLCGNEKNRALSVDRKLLGTSK